MWITYLYLLAYKRIMYVYKLSKNIMLQKEWDEAPEKKISFGDKVITPDGEGTVTELDPESELKYLVFFPDGQNSWYLDEELVVVKTSR